MIDMPPPPTYLRLAGFDRNIDRWQVIKILPPSNIQRRTGGRSVSTGERSFKGNDVIGMVALHAIRPKTATSSHYFWAQTHDFPINEPEVTQALVIDIQHAFHENLEAFAAQQAILQDPCHKRRSVPGRPSPAAGTSSGRQDAKASME